MKKDELYNFLKESLEKQEEMQSKTKVSKEEFSRLLKEETKSLIAEEFKYIKSGKFAEDHGKLNDSPFEEFVFKEVISNTVAQIFYDIFYNKLTDDAIGNELSKMRKSISKAFIKKAKKNIDKKYYN